MKKRYYCLLLAIVVLASVMPFMMHDRYGRPLLSVDDLKMPALSMPGQGVIGGLIDGTRSADPSDARQAVVTVYRWQDDQGIWHFSDNANPDGFSSAVDVPLNASVTGSGGGEPSGTPASSPPAAIDVDRLLQPGAMPLLHAAETIEQARHVEKVLQQRYQRQEQMLAR